MWFQNGVVNPQYLGCEPEYDATGFLDFSPDMFYDAQLYSVLAGLNVQSVRKVVPNLSPCADTISIARSGDTVRVPEVWNILRFELDLTGIEMTLPNLAYQLTLLYHSRIRLAMPSIVARFAYPFEGDDLLRAESTFSKTRIDPIELNDPHAQGLYNLSYGPWSVNYGTSVFDAWDLARGRSEVKIGVIDDGAYVKSSSNSTYGHEDFSDSLYGDVFLGGRNYTIPASSKYYQVTRHGTRVAGIIGAITNNSKGIAGVAGGSGVGDYVRMYALKAGDWDFNMNYVYFSLSWAAAAIFEAVSTSQNGLSLDLITLSIQGMPFNNSGSAVLMGLYDPLLHAAVAYAYRNDVPIFNSIGNKDIEIRQNVAMGCPASAYDEHIIVVGAYQRNAIWPNTAFGAEVLDLSAPGVNASTGRSSTSESGYESFVGTSSAAPHATGVAALMLELVQEGAGQANLPTYLAVEDYVQIMAEARSEGPQKSMGQPLAKNSEFGYGKINTRASLDLLRSPFELKHISVLYNAESGAYVELDNVTITSSEHGYLHSKVPDYFGKVRQYEFTTTVQLGATYPDVIRIWARGAHTKGFSDLRVVKPDPTQPGFYHTLFSDCGWAHVNQFGSNWAELTTYLYQLYDNGVWVWLNGIDPDDIVFELSILSGPTLTADPLASVSKGLFDLFPTLIGPNTTDLTIAMQQNFSGQLYVCDILGRTVKSIQVFPGQDRITLSAADFVKNGLYFVRSDAGSVNNVRKLVVAR